MPDIKMSVLVGSTCFGVALLIIGIILLSVSSAQEANVWYGVTMCPVTEVGATDKWLSRELPPAMGCPAYLSLNDTTQREQKFIIEKDIFSLDGLDYHPIFFRNTNEAILQFKLEDSNGQLLFAEGPSPVSNSAEATPAADEDQAGPAMRKLLKGGRGGASGTTTRARAGTGGRYGTNSRVTSTYYGSNSCCISQGVVVWVVRPGPRTRTGLYNTEDTTRDDCVDPKRGCAFELPANMYRDEFEDITFVPKGSMSWPLTFTVASAQTTTFGTTVTEPQLYFSFWTNQPDNSKIASYVLIPLGCVIFAAGIIVFFVMRTME